MAIEIIDIGTKPDAGDGDSLYVAFDKVNNNFAYVEQLAINGVQGPEGPRGFDGLRGYTGSKGLQGVFGYTGSTGLQGTRGYIGSKGDQGIQGPQGLQGLQGTQGMQGLQGTQGMQGLQGVSGTVKELSEIPDVEIIDAQDKDMLVFVANTSKWTSSGTVDCGFF